MSNQPKKDRQAVLDSIRKQQGRSERTRKLGLVGICLAIGLLIVGAAAFKPIRDSLALRAYSDKALADIGAEASVCKAVETKPAEGNQDHVPVGTPLEYPESPPAFGTHWDIWAGMDRKVYTKDRPELGELVHNLEHGYTVLWYDETISEDRDLMDDIRGIATKLEGTENMRHKFKAAPWTKEDGGPFPDDQHVAFTHWSIGGVGEEDPSKHVGVWQYCSAPSGAALEKFMEDYPYMDSPEWMGG